MPGYVLFHYFTKYQSSGVMVTEKGMRGRCPSRPCLAPGRQAFMPGARAARWPRPLLHVIPVLRVEAERRGLGRGALQVVGDLGDQVGGVYLPLHRKLRRQVV